MTNNDINATGVNPQKWGPAFWTLLYTIAQNIENYPDTMNSDLYLFVNAIPYVLPCNECSLHCKEIYWRLNLENNVSLYNFKKWVYTLKSEVNKYTNSENISYERYLFGLKQTKLFITKKQLLDLLGMMSMNYPHENDKESRIKRNKFYIFIQQLIKFMIFIPYFRSIGRFIPFNIWKNKKELQAWLKFYSQKVYKYNITFDY